jgi:hypothetical protein
VPRPVRRTEVDIVATRHYQAEPQCQRPEPGRPASGCCDPLPRPDRTTRVSWWGHGHRAEGARLMAPRPPPRRAPPCFARAAHESARIAVRCVSRRQHSATRGGFYGDGT